MKQKRIPIYLAVLSVFAGSNCLGGIDGALSKIAGAMQVSQTTALYAGSGAALACMCSGLLFGAIAGKKLPYRVCAILCLCLVFFGGSLAVFVTTFPLLLVMRCAFGLGVGGLMCISNPVATRLVEEEKRASILGIGTCVAFGAQCVLQLIGGTMADIRWNLVFLAHLIMLLPLLCVIFFLPGTECEAVETRAAASGKLPLAAILMCLVQGIVWLNIAPLLFGSAFYVAPITGSAVVAAVIAMMFSFGCMAGGLLYSTLYKLLKRYSFTVFLLLTALGLVISAAAGSIVLLAIGFFIGGIGQACMQAGIMMLLGQICPTSKLGAGSALLTVCLNLGAFLCSGWDSFLGRFTGGDTLYAPLYTGAAMLAVIAVVLLVKPPFPKQKTPDQF